MELFKTNFKIKKIAIINILFFCQVFYAFGQAVSTLLPDTQLLVTEDCVNDTIPPEIVCPPSEFVDHIPGECVILYDYVVSGSDNCGFYEITQTLGQVPNNYIFMGNVTDYAFIITDGSGNTATCTFSVTVSGDSNDDDCDGIYNECDICPYGDDNYDENNDVIADCDQLLAYSTYHPDWICGNNKIYMCHNGKTICVKANTMAAHYNHGDWVGPCPSCVFERKNIFEEDEEIKDFTVLNNPTHNDGIQIYIDGHQHTDANLHLYNTFGKLVSSQKIVEGTSYAEFSTNFLKSGHYYVKLFTGTEIICKQVVIIE